jgi:hypothetical protein
MIEIRRQHPGLRSLNFYPRDWDEGWTQRDPQGFGIDRARNIVVYHRWGDDGSGRLERFYVALNCSADPQRISFEVPDIGPWTDLVGGGVASAPSGRLDVDVGSSWGAVYYKRY